MNKVQDIAVQRDALTSCGHWRPWTRTPVGVRDQDARGLEPLVAAGQA